MKVDTSDKSTPGYKFADYELKGVPVRLAMGGRDLENGTIEIARRDTLSKETISMEGIEEKIVALLEEIQKNCYTKAMAYRIANTRECNSYEEFKEEKFARRVDPTPNKTKTPVVTKAEKTGSKLGAIITIAATVLLGAGVGVFIYLAFFQ